MFVNITWIWHTGNSVDVFNSVKKSTLKKPDILHKWETYEEFDNLTGLIINNFQTQQNFLSSTIFQKQKTKNKTVSTSMMKFL